MILKNLKKGAVNILLILVIVFVLVDILIIGGGSAALGAMAGSFSREGTPSETGTETSVENPEIPVSCGGVINQAMQYINKGIVYSQQQPHCGPLTPIGPEGVTWLDCSGYVSRVYREIGLLSPPACLTTLSIATSGAFTRIAKDQVTATNVLEPGDLILFGMGDPNGPPSHTSHSHVVIFLNSGQVLESGGCSGCGPHLSNRAWNERPRFYGVYRTNDPDCASEISSS